MLTSKVRLADTTNMILYNLISFIKGKDQFWKCRPPPPPLSKNEMEALIANHVKENDLTNT